MASSHRPHGRALVVALLMAVMVISVLDKTIFAFAGPQIIDELKLTPAQFGFVGSAFFFLYSVSGVLVGFLANRYPARWILSGMSVVWMLAQVWTAFSGGLAGLVGSRLLLGAGCGPGTAVTQHACFKWYAPRERVQPAALIQVALMLGAIAGAVTLPLIIQHIGWRQAYLILAAIGLVWLAVWHMYGREGTHDEGEAGEAEGGTADQPFQPYRRLLFNRSFAFITLAAFCCYLPTALIFSWVPTYLQKGRGLTPMASGYVILTATVSIIILNLLISRLSHRALQRGASVRAGMVAPAMAACGLGGLALGVMSLLPELPTLGLVLLITGNVLVNLLPAFSNSIVAFIAPSRQRGSMLAIHIGMMASAGMIAPHVVGMAVTRSGGQMVQGFELVVGVFGAVLMAAAVVGMALIDPERTRRELGGSGSPA